MDSAGKEKPVTLVGVGLHILSAGDRYDLDTKKAIPAGERG